MVKNLVVIFIAFNSLCGTLCATDILDADVDCKREEDIKLECSCFKGSYFEIVFNELGGATIKAFLPLPPMTVKTKKNSTQQIESPDSVISEFVIEKLPLEDGTTLKKKYDDIELEKEGKLELTYENQKLILSNSFGRKGFGAKREKRWVSISYKIKTDPYLKNPKNFSPQYQSSPLR
ncbi:MAG: hypothetical protein KC505_04930 [Myxococcales bacterium]|nr:hypothetical protein [Myxococcales bacterium]USN50565.1 MAG: hypothetical protein H6731_09930 [Myxococcales bacterium]